MDQNLIVVGSQYSSKVGFVYVFNLIVGTGALTMPRAFASAGWLLSSIGITILAFMSYLTLTFVIEAMAVANAIIKDDYSKTQSITQVEEEDGESEKLIPAAEIGAENSTTSYGTENISSTQTNDENLVENSLSSITYRVEMGKMATMFYPHKFMQVIFYVVLCIYLYGDLAIYAAAVPKSVRDVACTYSGVNILNTTDHSDHHCNGNLTDQDICWTTLPSITRINAYRIFLAIFFVSLMPFLFFNVQKTKYLQLFTTTMRWLSFSMMIVLAVIYLSQGKGQGHPPAAQFSELPTLFGVCVYSFMCHHSLPSMVTPIRNKSRLFSLFAGDYMVILGFYSVLSFTAIYTFRELKDLYTLNFFCDDDSTYPITSIAFIKYFLALFPVFTLSTNCPIIGVTLRNNLQTMGHLFSDSLRFEKIIFPLLTIVPPFCIAFATSNVEILVSVTGSYAGAGIQYVIPVALVYYARRHFAQRFDSATVNEHCSPFKHLAWLVIVITWFFFCVILVTTHHIISQSIS